MFSKLDIMVSRGRSLIGRAGVLTKWPSPIVPKFPSQGNFGDDGYVALGTSQGFLNSPKIKCLGDVSVSGKAVYVWHFFQKICFPKRFVGFGLFGDLSISHCTLRDQIKNRDNLSPNCSEPIWTKRDFPSRDVRGRLQWGWWPCVHPCFSDERLSQIWEKGQVLAPLH